MSLLTHTGLRRLVRRLHYWIGVAVALPFLVIAITGCLLDFGPEIDRLLSSEIYQPSGPERLVSAQTVLDTARADSVLPVMGLISPSDEVPVWIVSQGTGKGPAMGVQQESLYDPQTGHMIARRDTYTNPVRFLHRLHNAFLLEDGRQWVGILGLVLTFMIVSGLVVLLPPPRGWRGSFLPRRGTRGTRWLLDWHTAASLWPFLLVLLITLTGVTMEFPQSSRAVLGVAGGHMMGGPSQPPKEPFAISADQALAKAVAENPGSEVVSLSPAGQGQPFWRVTLRPAQGLWRGRFQVMVNAGTGDMHSMADDSLAGFYLAQQHGLHGGAAFGFAGRMVIFAAGLAQAFLAVTGLLVWLRRRRRAANALPQTIASQEI